MALIVAEGGSAEPLLADVTLESEIIAAMDKVASSGYPLELNLREGYDHSYYFIASFIEDHLRFHGRHLER